MPALTGITFSAEPQGSYHVKVVWQEDGQTQCSLVLIPGRHENVAVEATGSRVEFHRTHRIERVPRCCEGERFEVNGLLRRSDLDRFLTDLHHAGFWQLHDNEKVPYGEFPQYGCSSRLSVTTCKGTHSVMFTAYEPLDIRICVSELLEWTKTVGLTAPGIQRD